MLRLCGSMGDRGQLLGRRDRSLLSEQATPEGWADEITHPQWRSGMRIEHGFQLRIVFAIVSSCGKPPVPSCAVTGLVTFGKDSSKCCSGSGVGSPLHFSHKGLGGRLTWASTFY